MDLVDSGQALRLGRSGVNVKDRAWSRIINYQSDMDLRCTCKPDQKAWTYKVVVYLEYVIARHIQTLRWDVYTKLSIKGISVIKGGITLGRNQADARPFPKGSFASQMERKQITKSGPKVNQPTQIKGNRAKSTYHNNRMSMVTSMKCIQHRQG